MSNNSPDNHHSDHVAETDVIIGRVVSVNVPKKQLRIAPETSYPERFTILKELRFKTKEGAHFSLAVDDIRITPSVVLARVATESADELASVRGATVVVKRSERYPLPDGEYYVDDLVGIVVKDRVGNVVGRISEVWETPANDIYQVLDDANREILLPAIEDVILEVNVEAGEMIADISNLI